MVSHQSGLSLRGSTVSKGTPRIDASWPENAETVQIFICCLHIVVLSISMQQIGFFVTVSVSLDELFYSECELPMAMLVHSLPLDSRKKIGS